MTLACPLFSPTAELRDSLLATVLDARDDVSCCCVCTGSPITSTFDHDHPHQSLSTCYMMPPHKKQRTDGDSDRTSKVATEAAHEARTVAGEDALSIAETRRVKRAARRGRLQALPDLSLDVQFEASPRGSSI